MLWLLQTNTALLFLHVLGQSLKGLLLVGAELCPAGEGHHRPRGVLRRVQLLYVFSFMDYSEQV